MPGPFYLVSASGGPEVPDNFRRQLRGRFIPSVFCALFISPNFSLRAVLTAAVSNSAINDIHPQLQITWVQQPRAVLLTAFCIHGLNSPVVLCSPARGSLLPGTGGIMVTLSQLTGMATPSLSMVTMSFVADCPAQVPVVRGNS